METRVVTVGQLNEYIKKVLDHQPVLGDLWVKGEISNFKRHVSGHLYITLKDESGVLKAVMFRSAAQSLKFFPEDGMKVLARGRVSVYEAGGAYQLYIQEMTPDGVGALYIAYEQLKKRLEEEGLFSEEHKKTIPKYPQTVGVITAPDGAAVRDMIHVITRRYPLAEILLYPSLVQGAGAAENLVRGIRYMNRYHLCDTLIIGRGGGSIEDLWAFNEEPVARAIYESEIPVISAVGHETDFTIADFVADLRAPTPSAAAEIAVPERLELINRIQLLRRGMEQAVLKEIEQKQTVLKRFRLRSPEDRIAERYLKLDYCLKNLQNAQEKIIKEQQTRFSNACAKLDALSPLRVLARGYSVAETEDGSVIKSAKTLRKNMKFKLKLQDGERWCRVLGKGE